MRLFFIKSLVTSCLNKYFINFVEFIFGQDRDYIIVETGVAKCSCFINFPMCPRVLKILQLLPCSLRFRRPWYSNIAIDFFLKKPSDEVFLVSMSIAKS